MNFIDLIVKDVPDVDSVKEEIINNAMTTIANYLRRQVPISKEMQDAEIAITAIAEKNMTKGAI